MASQWLESAVVFQRFGWPAAEVMLLKTRMASPIAQAWSPSPPQRSIWKSMGWSKSQSPATKAKPLSSKASIVVVALLDVATSQA